jgi:hypothetical protein
MGRPAQPSDMLWRWAIGTKKLNDSLVEQGKRPSGAIVIARDDERHRDIAPPPVFEAVQVKLDQQRSNHTTTRYASDSLLMGLIFDDRGNRMTPTHATKAGVRYRYYISAVLNQGQATKAAKVNRVPAAEIEQLIIARVRQQMRAGARERDHMPENPELNDKDLISTYVARVDVNPDHLAIGQRREAPYEAVLGQMVTIREGGPERRVTAEEAFLLQLAKSGVEGGGAATRTALGLIEEITARRSTQRGFISSIVHMIVAPGSVTSALAPLRMTGKLDPTARPLGWLSNRGSSRPR